MARHKPNAPREIVKAVRRRDHSTCVICGAPGKEVDHIIPTSQGGGHTMDNLRVLCHECHRRKTTLETRRGVGRKQSVLYLPKEAHPGLI